MRVAVADLLLTQHTRRRLIISRPLTEAPFVPVAPAPRRPWYVRAWAWLRDQYNLVDWRGE